MVQISLLVCYTETMCNAKNHYIGSLMLHGTRIGHFGMSVARDEPPFAVVATIAVQHNGCGRIPAEIDATVPIRAFVHDANHHGLRSLGRQSGNFCALAADLARLPLSLGVIRVCSR